MTSVYSTAEVVIPDNPPTPMGYHLLIAMPKVEEKTKGGVILPGDAKNREDIASIVGKVVSVGRMLTQKQIPVSLQGHGAVRGLGDGQQVRWPPL